MKTDTTVEMLKAQRDRATDPKLKAELDAKIKALTSGKDILK